MKKGQPIRAGTGIGVGCPRKYGDEYITRVKRRYLLHKALGYHASHEAILATVAREVETTTVKVTYILQMEGLR